MGVVHSIVVSCEDSFISVWILKVARHQTRELRDSIKVVVYMGDHEDLPAVLLGQLERLGLAHLSMCT